MKHHIAIKFIAVFLCALSLVGVIASAGSIFVLTEMDLYSKSVDQVVDERLQALGHNQARVLALRYASTTLGGIPEDMAQGAYDAQYIAEDSFGYTLYDDQGGILQQVNPEYKEQATTFPFTPSGQYMYLVGVTPVEEDTQEEQAPTLQALEDYTLYDGYELFNAIPSEGVSISSVTYVSESGGVTLSGEDVIGFLFCNQNGQAVFRTYDFYVYDMYEAETVYSITFLDQDGETVYTATVPEGAGTVACDEDGCLTFLSSGADQIATVCEVIFLDDTGAQIYQVGGTPSIGQLYYDQDGYMVFRSDYAETSGFSDSGTVAGVLFRDEAGNTVCDAFSQAGVGEYSHDQSGRLVFRSSTPWRYETIPHEAVPVPATEETTLPDATEQTVAEATQDQQAPEAAEGGEDEPLEDAPSAASAVPEENQAESESQGSEETQQTAPATEPETEPETTAATVPETTAPQSTVPEAPTSTEPASINGKDLSEYEINRQTYYDSASQQWMLAEYVYVPMPTYTVELYLSRDSLYNANVYTVLNLIRGFRNQLFLVLGVSLLTLAVTAVYLCCAAARKPRTEEVRAGGLNRMPLDLYLVLVLGGVIALIWAADVYAESSLVGQALQTDVMFFAGALFAGCLLVVSFFFALAAQLKTPNFYWWHNSLCGRILHLLAKVAVGLEKFLSLKFFPALWRQVKKLWRLLGRVLSRLSRGITSFFRRLGSLINRFFSLLPLTWQWIAGGCAIVLILVICFSISGLALPLGIGLCLAIVLYVAHAFGVLLDSTQRMSKGDLQTRVPDKYLIGSFRQFAADLNDLAGVAVVAAQKQLKSERMKTELITNVSHDIKTPLTSIINYVDLLQKPHTQAQQAEYLEVLARQSQQLKKLIEDLIEMSKASTGNMTVELLQMDAVEAVNQALGEFNDKLDKAMLVPVFRHTEASAPILADGRLVWRVLSNILSNAVKYAMPGTRLYIDLTQLEENVVISIKNISREELNIDADELLERFVRGDGSRNTEGSGLGLNIARSLMELQKGQLQLLVDGDLFKVTLIFPSA